MGDSSAIARRCASLLAMNARIGRNLSDRLAEGLPRETIVECARREGLVLPEEVVELFAWRNGSKAGHALGTLWLLPGYYLLDLAGALRHRAELREFRPEAWLPLLSDGGPGVLAVQCHGPGSGRILCDDPGPGDERGAVAFPTLEAMLSAIEEAMASGAFFVDEHGYLDAHDVRWLPIAAQHSGGQPFWRRQLASLDDWVYVPAHGATPTVEISLPAVVRQGDWIDVKARRRNGTWERVRRRDVVRGQSSAPIEPPAIEEGVQANVRWMVEPEGSAEFNLPSLDGDLFARQVRFRRPGVYTVRARSANPAHVDSSPVTVTVVATRPERARRR